MDEPWNESRGSCSHSFWCQDLHRDVLLYLTITVACYDWPLCTVDAHKKATNNGSGFVCCRPLKPSLSGDLQNPIRMGDSTKRKPARRGQIPYASRRRNPHLRRLTYVMLEDVWLEVCFIKRVTFSLREKPMAHHFGLLFALIMIGCFGVGCPTILGYLFFQVSADAALFGFWNVNLWVGCNSAGRFVLCSGSCLARYLKSQMTLPVLVGDKDSTGSPCGSRASMAVVGLSA